jgi:hypothetical protein
VNVVLGDAIACRYGPTGSTVDQGFQVSRMHSRGALAGSKEVDVLALDQRLAFSDVSDGLDGSNSEPTQLGLV